MYMYLIDRSGFILSSGRDLSYFSRNVHSLVITEEVLLNSGMDRLLQIYNKNSEIQVRDFADIDDARQRVAQLLNHFKLEDIPMKRNQDKTQAAEAAATETKTNDTATGEAKSVKAGSSRIPKSSIIRLKTDKNPKREGSAAHKRFGLYVDGQTVEDFVKAGGTMGDINFDVGKGFIVLEHVDAPAASNDAPAPAAEATGDASAPASGDQAAAA